MTDTKTKSQTVRDAARRRQPIDGADAQALEGALSLTERDRDEARRELRALEWLRLSDDFTLSLQPTLPVLVYDYETDTDTEHPTYHSAAIALGMEAQ